MTSKAVQPRSRARGLFGAVGLMLWATGCSQLPDYTGPTFGFAQSFTGQPNATSVLLSNVAWWRRFDDPVLDQLVAQAMSSSFDLAAARERVIEARAQARTIGSGLSTDATIAYEGQGGSAFDLQTGPTADASLSWLLDPFGGRESQRAAAAARIEVADAEVDAARLLLLDSLMRAYIDLRFTQASLALRHIERRSRRRSVGLVRELLDANSAIRLDLVRAQALLAETETIIPVLEAAQTARMNEIAVLLGQAPGSTRLPPGREGRQLGAPPVSEIGVPADLVRNRPDIRIAERLYYAATADIGAARAALFPSLSLTGTISFAAFGGVETNTYGFGPSLTLPALPNGPRRAAVEVAESRARQAHTNWTSTVLSAIGGVETALADYQANHRAVAAARRSVRRYEEAVTLTRELLVNQGATVQDLLDAERQVAAARITLARTERDLAQSYANLNVALGSGNQS